FINDAVRFTSAHTGWTLAVIFGASLGESFAFVSLLFPGTTIIIAVGALIQAGAVPVWPVLIGAITGAVAGDFISYWLGLRLGCFVEGLWPFSRYPKALVRGRKFIQKYGDLSVFIGRFFGPLRAIVPFIAGTIPTRPMRFAIANIASAVIWAP